MENQIYLNTAAVGLVDEENIQRTQEYLLEITKDPFERFMKFMNEERNELRERAASFMGTERNRIVFTANFSTAQSQIASTLQGHRKKVLLYKRDYPSLKMPFERRNFHIDYIDDNEDDFSIDINKLEEVIKEKEIEILPISHVQYLTGFKIDIQSLSEVCERNDVMCILDITQSLGTVPISFSWPGIDVMISSSYKWLRAGQGAAVMAVSERFIDEFPPVSPGFGSMTMTDEGWYYENSVRGFEAGHPNVPSLLVLSEAIQSAMQYGSDRIEDDNNQKVSYLINGVQGSRFDIIGSEDLNNRAHILCIEMERDIHNQLTQMGFSTTWRKGAMRLSPHYYNTTEEIQIFIEALEELHR